MSKLDRLSERVSRLLSGAVQEVLGVVMETVGEYQEKTARTQRENQSLRRKLQELQDQITRGGIAAPLESSPLPEEKEDAHHQHEQDLTVTLKQDVQTSLPVKGQTGSHRPEERDVKQETIQHETHTDTEPQAECTSLQTTELCKVPAEEHTNIIEKPFTARTSHCAVTSDTTSSSLNLAVVKREPEQTDCSESEPPNSQFSACVDLSYNSTRTHNCLETNSNSTHAQSNSTSAGHDSDKPHVVAAGPHALAFARSNYTQVTRRHGFVRHNRAAPAFERPKPGRDHPGRDDAHWCVVCGKTFSRVGNLRIHQRCHTGEKPYGCVQCGRRFRQAGDLKKHKRVHTGEKPYYCGHCGKSFSRRENLKRHQKIHVGEILQLQQAWRQQQTT